MLSPVTMILRGYDYKEVKLVAEVLLESRYVKNMEITMNTEDAVKIIEKISAEYSDRLNIGAGTVQNYEELLAVVGAGARFVLGPGMMDSKMLAYCTEQGIKAIPGAMTASEVASSYRQGAFAVKIFPANEQSLSYAQKLKEPLGEIPLMAVGGINKDNVAQAFLSGYDYVGTAGGLFMKKDIKNLDKKAMLQSLGVFEAQVDRVFKNKK